MSESNREYWLRAVVMSATTAMYWFSAAMFVVSMKLCPTPSWIDVSRGSDGVRLGLSIYIAAFACFIRETMPEARDDR